MCKSVSLSKEIRELRVDLPNPPSCPPPFFLYLSWARPRHLAKGLGKAALASCDGRCGGDGRGTGGRDDGGHDVSSWSAGGRLEEGRTCVADQKS